MTDAAYTSELPDDYFRPLNAKEEEHFRKFVHRNWTEELPENFSVYHPVVRDEWKKIDLAKGVKR